MINEHKSINIKLSVTLSISHRMTWPLARSVQGSNFFKRAITPIPYYQNFNVTPVINIEFQEDSEYYNLKNNNLI